MPIQGGIVVEIVGYGVNIVLWAIAKGRAIVAVSAPRIKSKRLGFI